MTKDVKEVREEAPLLSDSTARAKALRQEDAWEQRGDGGGCSRVHGGGGQRGLKSGGSRRRWLHKPL